MKYVNQIHKEGKLTVRKNEDRGKRERLMRKDKSLQKAYVCLRCEKEECAGTETCFAKEERKRE